MFKTTKTQGYTLLEVIVTVLILGVLVSLSIPNLAFSVEKTRSAEGVRILTTLLEAQRMYNAETMGTLATDIDDLDVEISTSQHFENFTVDSSDPVATVDRIGGDYTLGIDGDGTITCVVDVSGTCAKFNY